MPNIPTIPGSAQIQTQQIGTKRDARPFLARLGAEADVIGEGLQVISDYEQKKQKAEEVAGFNAASITLNKTTSDYQHNLKTMDDKQIVPKWTELSAKTKEDLQKQTTGWNPAAKRKFSQTLDNWQADSTIQMQMHADSLGSQRRNATAKAAKNEFLATGDPSMLKNAKNALKAAKDAGDMTQEEYDHEVNDLDRGLQENQILNGLETDPVKTLKAIKGGQFKDVPEKRLLQLRSEAERVVKTNQTDKFNEVLQDEVAGKNRSDDAIRDMIKTEQLKPETGENYIRSRQRRADAEKKEEKLKIAAEDRGIRGEIIAGVHDHDLWQADPLGYKNELQAKVADITDPAMQHEMKDQINREFEAVSKGKTKPMEQTIYKAMEEDRLHSGSFIPLTGKTERYAGTLEDLRGMTEKQIKKQFGENATKESVMAEEHHNYGKRVELMANFFESHSKDHNGAGPTYDEAHAFRQKLEYPETQRRVVDSLAKNQDPNAEAKQWLKENPDDPRAEKVRKKLGL